MPTDIYFVGESVRVVVDEEPGQVAEAFTTAHGLPVRLTGQDRRGEVYINPVAVAFWSASEPAPEPPPSPESKPTGEREAVTDIWGKPLRPRPRR